MSGQLGLCLPSSGLSFLIICRNPFLSIPSWIERGRFIRICIFLRAPCAGFAQGKDHHNRAQEMASTGLLMLRLYRYAVQISWSCVAF
jgi:hypothetical protein